MMLKNFLYSASLKSIGLSCSLTLSLMHGFVTLCLNHLENICKLTLPVFHMLTHFIRQYLKITFVNTTADLIRRVFKYWEVIKLRGRYKFSKILIFA